MTITIWLILVAFTVAGIIFLARFAQGPCHVGLHDWGKWSPQHSAWQNRTCKRCGMTQFR